MFDFIEEARSQGGRVLIHCSQGVSRSAALVIAYLMWKQGRGYDEVYQQVKGLRGVVNPNIGFICQLLQWHKRRSLLSKEPQAAQQAQQGSYVLAAAAGRESPGSTRIYRLAPHSNNDPGYVVPKACGVPPPEASAGLEPDRDSFPLDPTPASRPHRLQCLDPRYSFVMQSPSGELAVWHGTEAPPEFRAAALKAARHLMVYESAGPLIGEFEAAAEPEDLWERLLAPVRAPAAQACGEVSQGAHHKRLSSSGEGAGLSRGVSLEDSYNHDWDVWTGKIKPTIGETSIARPCVCTSSPGCRSEKGWQGPAACLSSYPRIQTR